MSDEHFRFLQAENAQLLADFFRLLTEFNALPSTPGAGAAHLAKVRGHRALLANHRLAYEWASRDSSDSRARSERPPQMSGR